MKRIFIFLLFIFYGGVLLHSQDTLVMNDGSELAVKVLEIGEGQISYTKTSQPNGPKYTISLGKVFMAIYKGGKREIFSSKPEDVPVSPHASDETGGTAMQLTDGPFRIALVEAKPQQGKEKDHILVTAKADCFVNNQFFSRLDISMGQWKDAPKDYTSPNAAYYNKNYIVILPGEERLRKILFEKYESERGTGFGWALPPDFFSRIASPCTVAFLEQKTGNKEALGFGGIRSSKLTLKDCTSLEKKLLSVCLLWMNKNFGKPG